MSVTEEALLHAIRESPDDPLPRQALGDWMLERDDPREQALGELATSKTLAGLVELDLRGCHIGKRGQALLRERFGDALIV